MVCTCQDLSSLLNFGAFLTSQIKNIFQKIFQEYHHNGSISGPAFCRANLGMSRWERCEKRTITYFRPLVKSAYQKINFLIFNQNIMLWVLKRTVSMRLFFWAPKTDGFENIYNFAFKNFVYLNLCIFAYSGREKLRGPHSILNTMSMCPTSDWEVASSVL